MSSLLSPVGSQPARVYWMRRLAVLGVPLILILIIAVSCSGGGKKPTTSSNGSGGSTNGASTSGSVTDCAPGDLSASITTSEQTYSIGDQPVFTGTLTNVSGATCRLTTAPSDEIWTVTSGAADWWTTAPSIGCPSSDVATTKSLAPHATTTVSITWDGKRLDPGCTHGDAALPGTYHLAAKLAGVRAQQVTFHFTQNTD